MPLVYIGNVIEDSCIKYNCVVEALEDIFFLSVSLGSSWASEQLVCLYLMYMELRCYQDILFAYLFLSEAATER